MYLRRLFYWKASYSSFRNIHSHIFTDFFPFFLIKRSVNQSVNQSVKEGYQSHNRSRKTFRPAEPDRFGVYIGRTGPIYFFPTGYNSDVNSTF
jgi:hypothetical protein